MIRLTTYHFYTQDTAYTPLKLHFSLASFYPTLTSMKIQFFHTDAHLFRDNSSKRGFYLIYIYPYI